MEKTVPDFCQRQGDGGRTSFMPPEPHPETFPALERPRGEDPRAPFLQDAAKKPPEKPLLSGTAEGEALHGAGDLLPSSRDGKKGPPGSQREDPDFFSALARQEPDVALEAQHVADEPDPALPGAVPAPPLRTDLGPAPEERLDPAAAPGRADSRSSLGARNLPWDPPPEQPRGPREEPEQQDGGTAPAAPGGGGDEQHLPPEPKRQEGAGREQPEKRRGPQRPEWVPGPAASPGARYRDAAKAADPLPHTPFRAQPALETPPAAFRKAPRPGPAKCRGSEGSSSHRKGPGMDSDPGELDALEAAEWSVRKPGLPFAADLGVGKQSWTVNAEDSVERVPSVSLEPLSAPCGSYEVEMRPYVCSVLVEEQGREELGPEEEQVYTCIECSIYFKKKEHLMEHMLQHNRGPGGEQERDALGGQCQFCCGECGWAFADPAALEQHKRLHQESREKIMEEIQKLNEFPDEGREARLQCPKCVFGTNSSKIFVQHAKMHVKERKDQGAKHINLFGALGGGELRDGSVHGAYKPFKAAELAAPTLPPPHGGAKGLSTCLLCSFPAPNDNILKEHMKYAHSHLSWDPEVYEEDPNQPGTSRDTYSPARPGRFAEPDYFGKAERLFPPPPRESAAPYEGFSLSHPRLNRSNGATKKDFQASGFHARKAAPYAAPHRALGFSGAPAAQAYSQFALQQLKRKASAQHLEGEGDGLRGHPVGLEELRHKWVLANDVGSVDEELGLDLGEGGGLRTVTVPQAALDLKRTFRDTLKATDSSIATEEQQQQLRKMVPIVLLEELNPQPRAAKRPRGKPFKKKTMFPSRDFVMEEPLPLDVLLLDAPLEGPLELDDLLDSESPMLKNEERKCPYCPDRFHNGIGLANHVRGHLNRVGVSYNVRHFISAEEVKAIEQKFSFQKKKKKVANFDPSTFSLMRCEFCGAGFDTRAGLSSHARAHLRDFGITNWELTISPINILKELLANSAEHPLLQAAMAAEPASPGRDRDPHGFASRKSLTPLSECSVPRSPLSPFPPGWPEEPLQPYRDGC